MFISPMLLDTRTDPFDSADFIFEPKSNGVRLELAKSATNTKLYTRHGTDVTKRLPELLTLDIPDGTTLDGEVVCYDPANPLAEDFEAVMGRINTSRNIKAAATSSPIVFIVFDILSLNGESLTNIPLLERKRILDETVENTAYVKKVLSVPDTGIALFDTIKQFALEGIVAKRKESIYYVGKRPKDKWYKIINWRYEDCYIVGYRTDMSGWYIAKEDNGKMTNIGFVEFGMNAKHKAEFYAAVKTLTVKETKSAVWITPTIRCRVKHRGYLRSGNVMTPVFVEFIT